MTRQCLVDDWATGPIPRLVRCSGLHVFLLNDIHISDIGCNVSSWAITDTIVTDTDLSITDIG